MLVDNDEAMNVSGFGPMALGELIRSVRVGQGLKAVDLAAMTGLSTTMISRLETGTYKETPPPEVMVKIEKALKLPAKDMLVALGYEVDGQSVPDARLPDHDPRVQLHALVDRIDWRSDRFEVVRNMLQTMADLDRKAREGR